MGLAKLFPVGQRSVVAGKTIRPVLSKLGMLVGKNRKLGNLGTQILSHPSLEPGLIQTCIPRLISPESDKWMIIDQVHLEAGRHLNTIRHLELVHVRTLRPRPETLGIKILDDILCLARVRGRQIVVALGEIRDSNRFGSLVPELIGKTFGAPVLVALVTFITFVFVGHYFLSLPSSIRDRMRP
jgi:hypothetical protein